ncbi:MAG TPA: hypothetical protein VEP90_13270 [Methylomirabilota bacterium]|nr:hypothetical protein [Methylomirabilota bacterium]
MTKKSNMEKQSAVKFGLTNEVKKEPEPEFESRKGWFFATDNNRLRYGDNREIILGETHTTDHLPNLCTSGLHASPTVFNALGYAPGKNLYRVSVDGVKRFINTDWFWFGHQTKFVGKTRTYHAVIDASPILDKHVRSILNDYLFRQKINVNADIKTFLNTGLEVQHTLNHLTALDINCKEERNIINYVWRICQAQITTQGYAQMQLYHNLINDISYLESKENTLDPLNDLFLKEMNLTE